MNSPVPLKPLKPPSLDVECDYLLFKYVTVVKEPKIGMVKVFKVINKGNREEVGGVTWFKPWDRYVFSTPCRERVNNPEHIVLDTVCLKEIAEFLTSLMKSHRRTT